MIVDGLLAVLGIKSVVDTSFIVKRHILCGTQILRELLGKVETGVSVGCYLKTVHLATLGSNQDGTLGTLSAIEHDSLCTFEEGDLLDLGRKHIV